MRDDPKREEEKRQEEARAEDDEGRKPPAADLSDDPAYEPPEPYKGIKGG